MPVDISEIKLVLQMLKVCVKPIADTLSRRKQKRLVSTAIKELLKLDPDMDAADAALAVAEAIGVDATPELYRAKRMRDSAVAEKVAKVGVKKQKGYLYFVDKKGDISRAKMARAGKKRRKKAKKIPKKKRRVKRGEEKS